jgi:hypothetical protein
LPSAFFAECLPLGKAVFAECFDVPSVRLSVNKLFTERKTLPSAALGKVRFAECPIKSTRQSRWHSAKDLIPVVHLYVVFSILGANVFLHLDLRMLEYFLITM